MPLTEEELKAQEEGLKKQEEDLKKQEEEINRKKSDNSDPEYLKSELDKVIRQRDEAKKERRKLIEEVESVKTKLASSPSTEEVEDLKKQFDELKKFREDIEKQKEEEDLKQKSELERSQIQFNKELEKVKKDMQDELAKQRQLLETKDKEKEEISTQVETLRGYKLEGEIIKAATKYKALRPEQVYRLLRDEFSYNDTIDRFEFLEYDPKNPKKLINELDVDERVKNFLSLEDNDNLVAADLKKGTRTDLHNSDNKNLSKKQDISDSKYDPNDDDIKRQADLKGMSVEDHIRTLIMRDIKMSERNKK